jgi:hypothetical protein
VLLSTGTWFLLFGDQVAETTDHRWGIEVPASGVRVVRDQIVGVTWAATIHRMVLAEHLTVQPHPPEEASRRSPGVPTVLLIPTRPLPPQPCFEAAVAGWLSQRGPMTARQLLLRHFRKHGSRTMTEAYAEARSAGLGHEQQHAGRLAKLFTPETIWDRPRVQAQWEHFAPMLREWRECVGGPVGSALLASTTSAWNTHLAEEAG